MRNPTVRDEYVAALLDPVVMSVWNGTDPLDRCDPAGLHWLAMADRCEELGLTRQAEHWRRNFLQYRRQ